VEGALKEAARPAVTIPNANGIEPKSGRQQFPAAKICIYCGAKEYLPGSNRPLGEEHVIAEGLGGTLILPEASCGKCEAATSVIERAVLRTSLFATRARLEIRGKRRKREHGNSYPITTITGGKDVEIMMPLDVHPTILLMLGFNPPRIFAPADRRADIAGLWLHYFGSPEEAYRQGAESIASPSFDTVQFCQLIAKIGHSYAVAKLGGQGFEPLLPPFIRRRFATDEQYPECFRYIGGDSNLYAPSDDLHTLGHTIAPFDGRQYVVVYVRLFANLGAPLYTAVVGHL
jgi:hypothetical protein